MGILDSITFTEEYGVFNGPGKGQPEANQKAYRLLRDLMKTDEKVPDSMIVAENKGAVNLDPNSPHFVQEVENNIGVYGVLSDYLDSSLEKALGRINRLLDENKIGGEKAKNAERELLERYGGIKKTLSAGIDSFCSALEDSVELSPIYEEEVNPPHAELIVHNGNFARLVYVDMSTGKADIAVTVDTDVISTDDAESLLENAAREKGGSIYKVLNPFKILSPETLIAIASKKLERIYKSPLLD